MDRIAQREKKTVSYLRWILATLLVLAIGCGEEQPNDGEEQTTTANIFTTDSLDYVAFGDSLATGYGATYGYVYRYAAVLGMDTGAEVEGAGALTKWWYITIPLLKPTTLYLLVIYTILAFQVFDKSL